MPLTRPFREQFPCSFKTRSRNEKVQEEVRVQVQVFQQGRQGQAQEKEGACPQGREVQGQGQAQGETKGQAEVQAQARTQANSKTRAKASTQACSGPRTRAQASTGRSSSSRPSPGPRSRPCTSRAASASGSRTGTHSAGTSRPQHSARQLNWFPVRTQRRSSRTSWTFFFSPNAPTCRAPSTSQSLLTSAPSR